MAEINPLTQSDLDEINASLKGLDEADTLIQQAKQAGIDMGDQEQVSRETRQQLLRVKQTFFPGR